MSFYPGAYAQYCLAWADHVFELPPNITCEQSTVRDILGVAVHAVGRGCIEPGESVLCIGAGPGGLSIALVAQTRGASHIYLRENASLPRSIVQKYGCFHIEEPDDGEGPKVDVVFDTVGSDETVELGVRRLAPAGRYVSIAPHDSPLPMSMMDLGSERMITTSANACYADERHAHHLICNGELNVSPMITHQFPLDEYEHAFEVVRRREGFKVIIKPNS